MPQIHASAIVDPGADIASDVRIGPFCYVEKNVVIGPHCILDSHVTVKGGTHLGSENVIAQGAVIGGDPQDRKYKGEPTYLKVGDRNVFREYVTIHRATGEGNSTEIGNDCYLMAYCHIGHNCSIQDWVTMANSVGVSGHVTIESFANIGGMVGIHQFARIGKVAMVGGFGKVSRDIPPYMVVSSVDEIVHDINAVGLRRQGVSQDARLALHKACKLLYKSQLGLRNAMEIVKREVQITPEVQYLLAFEERRYQGKNGRGDQP